MVFGICKGIDLVVPDIPETLDVKIKRERYLAKQALADAEQLLQQVTVLWAGILVFFYMSFSTFLFIYILWF